MKVLCILQNAWGDGPLPIVFRPNERNKSCRVIRKIIGSEAVLHFANTTAVVTPTANGKPKACASHVAEVLKRIPAYDLILICGKQAEKSVGTSITDKPFLIIKHPAARDLSNEEIRTYKEKIAQFK